MTCKDCIHSGLCYKENDYENFPDRCGEFISDKVLEERPQGDLISRSELKKAIRERLCISSLKYLTEQEKVIVEEIDNAPTVAVNCKDCDGYEAGYSAGMRDTERPKGEIFPMEIVAGKCPIEVGGNCPLKPQGEFTRKELESWLYKIAGNNLNNELGRSCEEIIKRLDGFERFVSDIRKGDAE